jgi:putative membrane protein
MFNTLSFLIPVVVVVLVAALARAFYFSYWRPSSRIRELLNSVIPRLHALQSSGALVNRHAVVEIMSVDNTLKHLWDEYTETLHEQYDHIDGERRLVAIRATVPAEVFFNTQVLVDTPLNTEFFRHLPGLLTGIGIIGTFSGLIVGLSGFEPNGSAEAVKASLDALMNGVKEAFYASAIAISAAMLITFIEKSILTRRYKQVEALSQAIDTLYEAGAGEEYLARLVKAAEENTTHTAQLKQSLVDDLKQILTDLSHQQIAAQQTQGQQLAKDIGLAIQTGLQAPLDQIAAAVTQASGQQGTAVQHMLENLLTAFMAKIEETFGGQMRGLNEMMAQSTVAMSEIQKGFEKLIGDIGQTSQQATTDLTSQLNTALVAADQRHKKLEEQISNAVAALENQRTAAAEEEQKHLEAMAIKTGQFVSGLAQESEKLSAETLKAVAAMGESIDKMNAGAQDMYLAATTFKDAGNAVSGVMRQGATTMDQLSAAAGQVSMASNGLSAVMTANQNAQQTIQGMIDALKGVVEQAKREAGVSQQIVNDMNKVGQQLSQVEEQTQEYFEQLNDLLNTAFSTFGDAVTRELGKSNAAFQSEMGNGVRILEAAFQQLAAVISTTHKS